MIVGHNGVRPCRLGVGLPVTHWFLKTERRSPQEGLPPNPGDISSPLTSVLAELLRELPDRRLHSLVRAVPHGKLPPRQQVGHVPPSFLLRSFFVPSSASPRPSPPGISVRARLSLTAAASLLASGAAPQVGGQQGRLRGQTSDLGPRRGKPGQGAGLSLPSHTLGHRVSSQQEACGDWALPPFPSGAPVCHQLPGLLTGRPEASMWMEGAGPGSKACGSWSSKHFFSFFSFL